MAGYIIEFTSVERKMPWYPIVGQPELRSKEEAKNWMASKGRQSLGLMCSTCTEQPIIATRIRIVERRVVEEFIIK